jgi:hypothetical protein
MQERPNKYGRYALVLLATGASIRLLMMTLWRPPVVFYPGDATYFQTAQDILHFNFHALGDRVPVYPLLVALCGINPGLIWVAQSIFGVMSSLMIFDMAFRRTRHGLYSLLIGLACSLIPEILMIEPEVMTEALTNFLLVTSLWLIFLRDGSGENNIRYLLGLGSVVALAGLTRPLMLCLVPVYFSFLVPLWPPESILRREAIKRIFSFVLPVIVSVLGWCAFNYFNNGYFTPTTRAGQQLMDQVSPYVDLAPERFAVLRDIWLKYRRETHANSGSGTAQEAYLYALPELERQTGKTEIQVNHELASLALYLEIHHPLVCLRRVEQGCIQFWGEPNFKEVGWPQNGKIGLAEAGAALAKFLVREVKGAFLLMALFSLPCALFRSRTFTKLEYLVFAMALCISVCAAFTEFGDNRRFCIPLYMVIVYTVLTRGWVWITATSSKGSCPTPD